MKHPKITLPRRFTLAAQFHDHIPFVHGELNGQRHLFLFDSGGQDLLLNSRYLAPESTTQGGGIQGATGPAGSSYTQGNNLSFGEWAFEDFELMAIDMQHLEEEMQVTIHGIIGFRHLIHYDWMVDYAGNTISFWDRMVKTEFNILHKIPVTYRNHLPLVTLHIGDHPFQFLVDTGAAIVLLDQRHFDKVHPLVADCTSESMASASAIQVTVQSGTLSAFRLGDLHFGPSEVKFTDLSHMQSLGTFDGIIGYPLLSKYRVIQSWSFHSLYFLAD
jgi:hypothetical protein